jgi:hypothetical protein
MSLVLYVVGVPVVRRETVPKLVYAGGVIEEGHHHLYRHRKERSGAKSFDLAS